MSLFTRLFTARFIKDLILIALFGFSLYALIHNPIVNPKPPVIEGKWSIQLMQHPLVFGVAGHNYLTLRDEKNTIRRELHGLATDKDNGGWKYYGTDRSDLLKVWEFSDPHYYLAQKNYAGTVLFEGSEENAKAVWEKGLVCKDEINAKNLPYPPYGIKVTGDTENSNSVAYTLALCMNLNPKHLGLITPGWGKNILETLISKQN